MIGEAFRNPKVRRAYVLTKVGVFAGAAAMTWPLSRMIGSKAWIGLGIFGAVLLTLTIVVLAAAGKADEEIKDAPSADDEPPERGSLAP